MTTNNIHVLAGNKPAPRLLLADRDPTESAIAIRAIKRRYTSLEIWSVATLADAAEVLARERIETVLAGSGLDGGTLPQTYAGSRATPPVQRSSLCSSNLTTAIGRRRSRPAPARSEQA